MYDLFANWNFIYFIYFIIYGNFPAISIAFFVVKFEALMYQCCVFSFFQIVIRIFKIAFYSYMNFYLPVVLFGL